VAVEKTTPSATGWPAFLFLVGAALGVVATGVRRRAGACDRAVTPSHRRAGGESQTAAYPPR
jgi:hypothetical protein